MRPEGPETLVVSDERALPPESATLFGAENSEMPLIPTSQNAVWAKFGEKAFWAVE